MIYPVDSAIQPLNNRGQLVSVLIPVMSIGQNLLQLVFDKFAKRATCEFFLNSALFLLLVGSGPKRSMPIEKLGSSLLVSSVF